MWPNGARNHGIVFRQRAHPHLWRLFLSPSGTKDPLKSNVLFFIIPFAVLLTLSHPPFFQAGHYPPLTEHHRISSPLFVRYPLFFRTISPLFSDNFPSFFGQYPLHFFVRYPLFFRTISSSASVDVLPVTCQTISSPNDMKSSTISLQLGDLFTKYVPVELTLRYSSTTNIMVNLGTFPNHGYPADAPNRSLSTCPPPKMSSPKNVLPQKYPPLLPPPCHFVNILPGSNGSFLKSSPK